MSVRIENWSICSKPGSLFEECRMLLRGNVYGHQKHEDGTFVTTSVLKEFNFESNFAITANSKYELGTPEEGFIRFLEESKYKLSDYNFITKE